MQVFLKEVARQIFDEFSGDMSKHKLVFPNRRSSLYFNKYFSAFVDKPLLAPDIFTINELFQTWSSFKLADPLYLMFRLYESYNTLNKAGDPFDEFYYWGDMIINDFDDIDKYLVDSRLIFQNLKDLRDIDAKFGGFEPEVIEIIRQFWSSFDPSSLTPEKDDFLAVWDMLSNLYSDFKQILTESGMAYEGMLMREVVEAISSGSLELRDDKSYYHFIGFNALNKCEKVLMEELKKAGKAFFYWDYDKLYVNEENHEAGFFLRNNLSVYGQDLKGKMRYDKLISSDQPSDKYEVYKAPSDVAQAKLIPEILKDFNDIGSEPDNTAIVLADENMLMPVINSVPASIKDINITMGYPLYQTPVYSLIHQLLSLRRNARKGKNEIYSFYHADVIKILSHQYITFANADLCDKLKIRIKKNNLIRIGADKLQLNEFLGLLFDPAGDHISYNKYLVNILGIILNGFSDTKEDGSAKNDYLLQQEYLYKVIASLKRLETVLDESQVIIGLDIYIRIVDKVLHKLIVPFTGEPLCGLQVMGILETRALDFKNIIFLSVNEGVLPRGSAGNSYIPYNLRMAFGLPTVKHQDSIYAYYFYRLIQRARRVRFIYNSSASGMRTGEMSRFLLQLKYDLNFNTTFKDSRFNIVPPPVAGEWMKRDSLSQNKLEQLYLDSGQGRRGLSPSALNTWIICRMKFFFRYIVGIEETDNIKEEVDSPMFGTILHDAMNKLYSSYAGVELSKSTIQKLAADNEVIDRVLIESFRKNYLRGGSDELSGKNIIITSVMKNMITRILDIDIRYAPLKILELEKKYYSEIDIASDTGKIMILLGGTIDRVDKVGSVIRILDYKSGKDSLDIDSLEGLTAYNNRNRNSAAFQTFVYSQIFSDNNPATGLRPSLYPVRSIYKPGFTDVFNIKKGEFKGEVHDFALLSSQFRENLKLVVSDIFDPERDFDMTGIKENCSYCPYSRLCGRYDLT